MRGGVLGGVFTPPFLCKVIIGEEGKEGVGPRDIHAAKAFRLYIELCVVVAPLELRAVHDWRQLEPVSVHLRDNALARVSWFVTVVVGLYAGASPWASFVLRPYMHWCMVVMQAPRLVIISLTKPTSHARDP